MNRTIEAARALKAGGQYAAKKPAREKSKKTTTLTDDREGTRYVKSLIDQLLALSADDGDDEHHHHQDTDQTVMSLDVLTTVLTSGPEDQQGERQLLLNTMGLATVALKMAACEDDDLCHGGLRLAMALLDGGNSEVQQAFLELLQAGDAEHLVAADGTEGSFLAKCKLRLIRGQKEIKERKIYLQQQADRREDFDEMAVGLSAAAKEAMREDIERPYPSRAFVVDVLETLRLLCEGHNEASQDFLREQPNQQADSNLVDASYVLLQDLEPEIDESNIDQAKQAIDTLTELVQGNTSGLNGEHLLGTKCVSLLERLLNKKTLGDNELDGGDLPELRNSALLLLHALLEGGHGAEQKMLWQLDLDGLAGTASRWYAESLGPAEESYEDDDARRALLLDGAFSLYILSRHLKDFNDAKAGGAAAEHKLPSLTDESRDHFDGHVARVEIVNANGELERVYFRFPSFCLLLTEESKQEILPPARFELEIS